MSAAELSWRLQGAARTTLDRAGIAIRRPRWTRRDLAAALSDARELSGVRADLLAGRFTRAHSGLAAHLHARPGRFVIASRMRTRIAEAICQRFPQAAAHATACADWMLAGRYDLLGYRNVPFDGRTWNADPVHGRSAPLTFWAAVPYLDARCGDHKIIWELNRHQHWLVLGRAYWLTGDVRYRRECLAQLASWLQANRPLVGINWASMLELGLRAISWTWAVALFADPCAEDDEPWLVDLLVGLDRQLRHVERYVSYYFSPNTHLLGEALGLYVTGMALPELRASARRAAIGRRILADEVTRQIEADGGHAERSGHYHRYTLDFYSFALAIARLNGDPVASVFADACHRLARAARVLADESGRLPQLGDDDGGSLLPIARRSVDDVRDSLAIAAVLTGDHSLLIDAPTEECWWVLGHERFARDLRALEDAAPGAAPHSTALSDTGYYVSRESRGHQLIIDGGPHGYLNAGHAHADALSLTLTWRDQPLLIDTGTACYTTDPAVRDRFRSTSFHNTLTLDGQSQSCPRGPFHWERATDADVRRWHVDREFDYFAGTHAGYAPLAHWRHVLMLHGDLLIVADAVIDGGETPDARPHHAAVHWHLHPRWAVDVRRGSFATLTCDELTVELSTLGGSLEYFRGDPATGLGWHSPAYGRIEPTTTLRLARAGRPPLWLISVFSLDSRRRIERVALEPVCPLGNAAQHAVGVRIERDRCVDRVLFAETADDRADMRWRMAGLESGQGMLLVRRSPGAAPVVRATDRVWTRGKAAPCDEPPVRSHPWPVPRTMAARDGL